MASTRSEVAAGCATCGEEFVGKVIDEGGYVRTTRSRPGRPQGIVESAAQTSGVRCCDTPRAATAATRSSSPSSMSIPSPRTRVPRVVDLEHEVGLRLAQREAREPRPPVPAIRCVPGRNGDEDVVGVRRQLAGEVERLPAGGVEANARVDLTVASFAEAPAGVGVVGDELPQHLVVRHSGEPGDAGGVEGVDRVDPVRGHPLEQRGHLAVETGAVVGLRRGEVRDDVTDGPPLAP